MGDVAWGAKWVKSWACSFVIAFAVAIAMVTIIVVATVIVLVIGGRLHVELGKEQLLLDEVGRKGAHVEK